MPKLTRREALKTVGALAGTLASTRLLSGCGDDGDGGAGRIDTMIFMCMENRSYNHYLGSRKLEGKGGDGLVAGMSCPDKDGNPIAIWQGVNEPSMMCVNS